MQIAGTERFGRVLPMVNIVPCIIIFVKIGEIFAGDYSKKVVREEIKTLELTKYEESSYQLLFM